MNTRSLRGYGFTSGKISSKEQRLELSNSELMQACQHFLSYPEIVCQAKFAQFPSKIALFPDYIDINCERRTLAIEQLLQDEDVTIHQDLF